VAGGLGHGAVTAWQDGFVPCGWTRGEPLLVTSPATLGDRIMRGLVEQEFIPFLGPHDALDEAHVAHVTFMPHEMPYVSRWLKWWMSAQ
jgi:hypothetical protein